MATTEMQKKMLPEQTGQHVYHPVPPRTATTQQPRRTPRTNAPQTDEEEHDALYQERPPSSVRRYPAATTGEATQAIQKPKTGRPVPRRSGHSKGFYTLVVGGSVLNGCLIHPHRVISPIRCQKGRFRVHSACLHCYAPP